MSLLSDVDLRLQRKAQGATDEIFDKARQHVLSGLMVVVKDYTTAAKQAEEIVTQLRSEHGDRILAREQKRVLDKLLGDED